MDNLILSISDIKPGERIEIPCSEEKVAELEMCYFKLNSYQNLFASFMGKSNDQANEFSLQKFLDTYTELAVKEYYLVKALLVPVIGEDGFEIVRCPRSNFTMSIDNAQKKLHITNSLAQDSCSN